MCMIINSGNYAVRLAIRKRRKHFSMPRGNTESFGRKYPLMATYPERALLSSYWGCAAGRGRIFTT